MPKILVIYYSRTGNTKKMAELITQAIEQTGAEAELKQVADVNVDEIIEYDAIVMGSPTYYGAPAYQIRKLIDESVKFHGKLAGKIGGAFSSSANIGGGNETTILNIINAWLVHGMVVIGISSGDHYGPVSINAVDDRSSLICKNYGNKIGNLAKKLFP
ncbi:flavodoxin domain-containing protein [bacterium]|nr:flavodoxin domain-containing protein [bacterium]